MFSIAVTNLLKKNLVFIWVYWLLSSSFSIVFMIIFSKKPPFFPTQCARKQKGLGNHYSMVTWICPDKGLEWGGAWMHFTHVMHIYQSVHVGKPPCGTQVKTSFFHLTQAFWLCFFSFLFMCWCSPSSQFWLILAKYVPFGVTACVDRHGKQF